MLDRANRSGIIMGGDGSGRWGSGKSDAKALVESCLRLEIKFLVRKGVVRPDVHHRASWEWLRRDRETVDASIGLEVMTGADAGAIHLRYTVGSDDRRVNQNYPVSLETTTLPFGGRRWWFRCPAGRVDGGPCGRRVAILYLPPSQRVFACRHCHDLAYESSRESRKWSGMFASLGADMGLGGREVKKILEGRFRVERRISADRRQRPRIEKGGL
jgi:hypothetical protein